MSDILTELAESGFEIIKDDTGQDLVKLVFMDENDEATGYALVSPEDAKRILSGKATLQNVTDEDGKQVLTLAPVDAEAPVEGVQDSESLGEILPSDSVEAHEQSAADEAPVVNGSTKLPLSNKRAVANVARDTPVSANEDASATAAIHQETPSTPVDGSVEQFVLNEETSLVDGKSTQVVTLLDSQGHILAQKHGNTGEQVVLEVHGQMLSYEIQGPSESGEPITSTLLMSSGDALPEDAAPIENNVAAPTSWSEEPAVQVAADQQRDELPAGQQFTLTEATTLVDGEPLQTVLLTDDQGNVLDQKQGRVGEHVIIEMSGNSLEYVFLGPTENGEPITTTLMVSSEPESADLAATDTSVGTITVSEAINTASGWCPPGLPSEFYSILCRQVEQLVTSRILPNADGSPAYRPEPYHRKLGSLATYQEMSELFNSYRIGASNGETLTQYENLRNFAKIYRPSGPHSRALTKYEIAMNEAAAQICRYHPGLLFHKRELFHMAKDVVEKSQTFLTNERRQASDQPLRQPQLPPTSSSALRQQLPRIPQPAHPLPTHSQTAALPPTAVVSGRVASSQLAMLESRGLSGIIQPPASTTSSSAPKLPPVPVSQAPEPPIEKAPPVTQGPPLYPSEPRMHTSVNESSSLYSGSAMSKRELFGKLTVSQEEALRAAALNIIMELPPFDLKPKSECTNIELTCWDQAKLLASQAPTPGSMDNVSAFLNNEKRLSAVREAAALYGRPPGAYQYPVQNSLSASTVTTLIPYEVACNEAAAYLACVVPQLLTHRRELSDLAKKIVRNSGCLFTNTSGYDKMSMGAPAYKFYCPEQLPELDLSAADQLLADPLDRSESPDSGCCLSPVEKESKGITKKFQTLALSCEECNNIIDDVAIYSATGTDSLKKVRILNLAGCAFTGIMPNHLNQCSNLIELNLSGNALCAFPRCLHLPKLKRLNLRNNPGLLRPCGDAIDVPLIEQFPRLVSVELDPPLVNMLSRQALVCLCPYLKYINGEEFIEEPTEETVKILQSAKHQLSTLVYSKWEDDIAGFYKKGLPKRDAIRVIETLVLHAVKRCVDIGDPFTLCKSVLARRVAEDFLSPKMLEDEYEDDTSEKMQPVDEASDEDEEMGSDSDEESADEKGVKKLKDRLKPKKKVLSEASVAEREAEAAAANLALLPDEPSDRLTNVVGQALRHGKTVVYAVIRTAARRPDGELIPVGGGLGVTSSTSAASPTVLSSKPNVSVDLDTLSLQSDEDSILTREKAPTKLTVRQPKTPTARKPGPKRAQQKPRQSMPKTPSIPTSQHSRRPGLLSRGQPQPAPTTPPSQSAEVSVPSASVVALPLPTKGRPSAPKAATQTTDSVTTIPVATAQSIQKEPVVYTIHQRLLPSDYIIKPSRSESQPAYVVPSTLLQKTPKPARRGRPPGSTSRKTVATAPVPVEVATLRPHSPPPPSMRMSLRDSNRMKRFSVYGVFDTSLSMTDLNHVIINVEDQGTKKKTTSPVVKISEAASTEQATTKDTADVAQSESSPIQAKGDAEDPIIAKAKEDNMVVILDTSETECTIPTETEEIQTHTPRKTPSKSSPKSAPKSRRRRTVESESPAPEPTSAKRTRGSHASTPVAKDADVDSGRSLSQLGSVVDYDPLHFIRCHARDNDPLDCKTKVWRCAFEPSLENPRETSTIVATCGGECVCLIDCRSGRVMKRFKHLNEEFYSLAWTTVEMAVGHRTNLLAAAGKLREIRLLHPEQLVCYAEMRGHKDDIACMIFHPEKPTILFSGDSKATVLVWDIGIPSAPEYRTRHQLLMKLICPRPNLNPILNLIFLPKFETLVAGCEDGVFSWSFTDYRKQKTSEERPPDFELKIPTRHEPCFDGLARLSDRLMVVKCVEEGELYVIDYNQVIEHTKRSTATNTKTVNVDVRGQLRWQNTEEIYINVTARSALNTVVCGDNEGTIWLYDLQKYVTGDSRKFKLKPVKILEWPECSVGGTKDEDAPMKESITSGFKNPVVNSTDISHDGQYLVAVTDNNLVCIWKFSG